MITTALIFRVAVAVMALHIVDDSFLQPAPGTAPGDHLVSGVVPLALLAAAAWAFPRARAGGQAVLALILGPFAIALGAEAVYYGIHGRLGGDDFTGLLALACGFALLGAAIALLWRSRRLDEARYRRYPRRFAVGFAGLLGFAWVVAPFSVSYAFTHLTRAEINEARLGAAYENVTIRTRDGLELEGWYVPSRNGAAVLVYPGRGKAQDHARMLADNGYGVLLFDRRGEGASEGEPHAFGWTLDEDIKAGVAFLKARPDVEPGRIGGIGLSVGGEMLLQTAASEPALAAVVSDGAGSRMLTEEMSDLEGPEKLLEAMPAAVKMASLALFSNHLPPSNLETYIPRIAPRPILLIHAGEREVDNKTPEYLAAARGPAEEWAVPEGGHVAGVRTMPEEYERRLVGFFDRSLGRSAERD